MSQTISAIYENETLILEKPLAVSEGSKVEVIVVVKDKKEKNAGGTFGGHRRFAE
ncbi:MAG: antitoxin family protein [Pyrinomonadaceae bacterium]|nr:antitoxin family protein [Pyrinomonadaceae bacterium]